MPCQPVFEMWKSLTSTAGPGWYSSALRLPFFSPALRLLDSLDLQPEDFLPLDSGGEVGSEGPRLETGGRGACLSEGRPGRPAEVGGSGSKPPSCLFF